MTDNNIIKALKCCLNDNTCGNCPFKSETDNICKYTTVDFYSIILDFINHQQSEIEYLKQENSLLHMLMKDSRQTIKQNDILLTNIESHNFIPEPCRNCTNHPSNGGDGMCNCTLGGITIYG